MNERCYYTVMDYKNIRLIEITFKGAYPSSSIGFMLQRLYFFHYKESNFNPIRNQKAINVQARKVYIFAFRWVQRAFTYLQKWGNKFEAIVTNKSTQIRLQTCVYVGKLETWEHLPQKPQTLRNMSSSSLENSDSQKPEIASLETSDSQKLDIVFLC